MKTDKVVLENRYVSYFDVLGTQYDLTSRLGLRDMIAFFFPQHLQKPYAPEVVLGICSPLAPSNRPAARNSSIAEILFSDLSRRLLLHRFLIEIFAWQIVELPCNQPLMQIAPSCQIQGFPVRKIPGLPGQCVIINDNPRRAVFANDSIAICCFLIYHHRPSRRDHYRFDKYNFQA